MAFIRPFSLLLLAFATTVAGNTAAAATGAQLYASNCGICHQANGAGAPGVAPPLRSELWQRLGARSPGYLAGVLVSGLVGMQIDGQSYGAAMPAWTRLSDAEISAIGNFVLQKLNGMKVNVPEGTIKEARAAAPDLITLKHLRDGS